MHTPDMIAVGTMVVTGLGSVATAVMAVFTWKNIAVLTRQMRSQVHGDIVDAHKDLYLQILGNEHLSHLIAGGDVTLFRRNMLGSLLINHCSRIFANYEDEIVKTASLEDFVRDAEELFEIPLVKERWPAVRSFHSVRFREFVEHRLLHVSLGDQIHRSSLS